MKLLKKILIGVIGIVLAVLYSYNTWSVPIYDNNIDSATYGNVGELLSGSKVEQSFKCSNNGLESIELVMSNLGFESDMEYYWGLQEKESNMIVREGTFKCNEIDNSQAMLFEFEPLNDSKNKEYVFTVEAKEKDDQHGATVMMTSASKEQKDGFILNGKQEDMVLVLTQNIQYLNIETGIVFLGMYLYLIIFMTFLMKLFK